MTTDKTKNLQTPRPEDQKPQVSEPDKTKDDKDNGDLEAKPMGPVGIILLALYIAVLSISLFYGIAKLWPSGTSQASQETILFWTIPISAEARMIVLVGMAGALGSMVHVLRSFYWYLGNRELVLSWWAKYIFMPFVGATLGIIFYLVIRGGFFAPQSTIDQTVPFSFVDIAALVGMFSEAAITKLKDVAETLLKAPDKGKNATEAKQPSIPKTQPKTQPPNPQTDTSATPAA